MHRRCEVSQKATESIEVKASVDTLYAVASDYLHYPDWVADVKKVTVLSSDESGRPLDVEFRAAAFGRTTSYTLRYDYSEAPATLRWSQVRGDLTTRLDGSYDFRVHGDSTTVRYELEVDLLVPIPSFVKSRAAGRIQVQALRELKARAESLA